MFCANCGTRLEDEYRYAGTDSVSTRIVSIDMGGPEQNGSVPNLWDSPYTAIVSRSGKKRLLAPIS